MELISGSPEVTLDWVWWVWVCALSMCAISHMQHSGGPPALITWSTACINTGDSEKWGNFFSFFFLILLPISISFLFLFWVRVARHYFRPPAVSWSWQLIFFLCVLLVFTGIGPWSVLLRSHQAWHHRFPQRHRLPALLPPVKDPELVARYLYRYRDGTASAYPCLCQNKARLTVRIWLTDFDN